MKTQEVEIPYGIISDSSNPTVKAIADKHVRWRDRDDDYLISVPLNDLDDDGLKEIYEAAKRVKNQRVRNTIGALIAMRSGDTGKKVPNYKAFPAMLAEYINATKIRGWLFAEVDGHVMPYFVSNCTIHEPRSRDDGDPRVTISTSYVTREGRSDGVGQSGRAWHMSPSEIAHKPIPEILEHLNILQETDELLRDYDATIERFKEKILHTFARQLEFTPRAGRRAEGAYYRDEPITGVRKVINDTEAHVFDRVGIVSDGSSTVLGGSDFKVPLHPTVRVFDLKQHEFFTAHSDELEPYVFDKSLRDKLVLPQSHRDLLDVLVSDLSVFSNDIVRGKSAGNIIVCQGKPGLGKTLTCEVYSEITETPIYAVHSGTLGTDPASVQNALKKILQRQDRWGCIVLLDEADVFISQRGENLVKNSIVAEFLRVLEYCNGLIFMTTNREDDIDEAIISRAAAIINYDPPSESHRRELWRVMFEQNEFKPPHGVVDELVDLFPEISGRDIKMLLRLALRVHTALGDKMDADLFRKCAMFRNIKIADG